MLRVTREGIRGLALLQRFLPKVELAVSKLGRVLAGMLVVLSVISLFQAVMQELGMLVRVPLVGEAPEVWKLALMVALGRQEQAAVAARFSAVSAVFTELVETHQAREVAAAMLRIAGQVQGVWYDSPTLSKVYPPTP